MNLPSLVPPLEPSTHPRRSEHDLAAYKALLSLALFVPATLLVAGPFVGIDLAPAVLSILSLAAAFTSVRAGNVVRMARRVRAAYDGGAPVVAPPLRWRHVIVVPIYKETVRTISRTLERLASHAAAATNYVVLCAFEEHDPAHEDKSRRLGEAFGNEFLALISSVHAIQSHECPGKAANVNHAVRTFAAAQDPESYATTFVTVLDCDTLVDERYFPELERRVAAAADPHAAVFAAPALFESNRAEVPCFVRAMDDLWSLSAAANLFSLSGLGFPISNYSLSLRMLDEMDYWDVGADAVGEDFHTFVKAAATFGDRARLVPLAVPMNNEHVAGHDYRGSLLARYSQSLRHALGISSTAYLLRHLTRSAFSPRRWLLLLLCLESHLLPLLYFACGLYVVGCLATDQTAHFFRGIRTPWFLGLWCVSIATFAVAFGAYKQTQYYLRRRGFGRRTSLARSLARDAVDLGVQGTCALAYFLVPFGYRACQNLVFRRHRTYYGRIEERSRRYHDAGTCDFAERR